MEKFSELAKILIKLLEKILYLGLKASLHHISSSGATRRSNEGFGENIYSSVSQCH
jgi:hypothetical protein